MTKTLMGAVISPGKIEATYRYAAFGAVKVARKEDGWPDAVVAQAAAFLADIDAEAGALGAVVKVQIYTPITDPQGHPGFSGPGECIDIEFAPGNSPPQLRIGDDEVVPAKIAADLVALKAAIEGAL